MVVTLEGFVLGVPSTRASGITPRCSPPHHASEFQSNALEEYRPKELNWGPFNIPPPPFSMYPPGHIECLGIFDISPPPKKEVKGWHAR